MMPRYHSPSVEPPANVVFDGEQVSGFLLAIALAIAFVAGSALALRPSPRQRQLARLRECAVASGLRVQWRPGGRDIDYLMPWDLADTGRSRTVRLSLERAPGASWAPGETDPEIVSVLAALPSSVTRVQAVPEGLQACWNETGTLADVEVIARALRDLGGLLLRAP